MKMRILIFLSMCIAFISCKDEENDNRWTIKGVIYEKMTENTVKVIGGDGKTAELLIPQTITIKKDEQEVNYTVREIAPEAFSGDASIQSVYIPNSVVSIGENAFYNCYNIKIIVLGKGIKSIGTLAFNSTLFRGSVIILASTPPALGTDVFYLLGSDFYVPKESYDAYTDVWNKNIYKINILSEELMNALKEYGY